VRYPLDDEATRRVERVEQHTGTRKIRSSEIPEDAVYRYSADVA
jgi:hypothetical protein